MTDEKYCRCGWCRCEHHRVVKDVGDEWWDSCNVTASHTRVYERCPVPSKIKTVEPPKTVERDETPNA